MEGNVRFLTIEQFKAEIGIDNIDVLENTKTDKLFMSGSNGQTWKVEKDIDPNKPMKVLVENGDMDEACLVNVDSNAKVLFSV